jgi:putative heme-binding domain-containing protein
LEQTSGGGQYGLSADDYQRWFTATNSQHLRQIVLPEHYLKRNPNLPVSAVTIDIPEHGAAARVFRISPFEPWRVERTTRRAGGPDSKRFATTELVPGGYITSACSPLIYCADLFPQQYFGNNFVCDPANNLIHYEILKPNGAVYSAVRAYPEREFLASTDNWFRPVHLSTGPDGAVYILDFYREVIETPLSLPGDIKKQLDLESRGRGRIWRLVPTDFKAARLPDFSQATPGELATELTHHNATRRITAQRLLVESQAKDAAARIRELLPKAAGTPGRVNLLWSLEGLGLLKSSDVQAVLHDPLPGVRANALRLAEPFLKSDPGLAAACAKLVNDPDPMVRFQLAFTSGFMPSQIAAQVLASILTNPATDSWTLIAAYSSLSGLEYSLLETLTTRSALPDTIVSRLASMIGARGEVKDVSAVLTLVATGKLSQTVTAAILDGLGQGMRNSKVQLGGWLATPPAGAESAVAALIGRFEAAAVTVNNNEVKVPERVAAAKLLAYGPFSVAGAPLAEALGTHVPVEVQLAAVRSLATHADVKVAEYLIKDWKGYTPSVRTVALDALLSRPDRILALLAAIERKQLAIADLSPAQVQQLKAYPNANVRTKANAVLTQTLDSNRTKVIASFRPALELKGDAKVGKTLFQKHCSACHKLEGVGHEVGPELLAVLGNKSGEDLLIALLDPNREVDPRYRTYQVGTADERVLTGIVAAETPTSITLRRAEGVEEVILRANLELFRVTTLSLMPEGLEKELKPQDVADLFAYLRSAGK